MEDGDVVAMLAHEAQRYAQNQLTIPEETTQKILELCKRYPALGDFSMPKNASVFMDEVATAYRIKMHSKPEGVIDQEQQIADYRRSLQGICLAMPVGSSRRACRTDPGRSSGSG